MAGMDFVVVPSDSTHVAFHDLNLGRCRQEILCRLLRFWDSRNIKRGNKFMGIIMLFLDEKVVVSTKSPQSEKQYVWKSVADSTSYVIREETDPQKFLRRGMQISKGTLLQLFTLAACFEHCVDKYRRLVMSAVSPQANIDNILLRNAGSNRESTGVYFQAALKLLLALSMPQIRALPDPRKSMAAQQNFAEFSVLRKN